MSRMFVRHTFTMAVVDNFSVPSFYEPMVQEDDDGPDNNIGGSFDRCDNDNEDEILYAPSTEHSEFLNPAGLINDPPTIPSEQRLQRNTTACLTKLPLSELRPLTFIPNQSETPEHIKQTVDAVHESFFDMGQMIVAFKTMWLHEVHLSLSLLRNQSLLEESLSSKVTSLFRLVDDFNQTKSQVLERCRERLLMLGSSFASYSDCLFLVKRAWSMHHAAYFWMSKFVAVALNNAFLQLSRNIISEPEWEKLLSGADQLRQSLYFWLSPLNVVSSIWAPSPIQPLLDISTFEIDAIMTLFRVARTYCSYEYVGSVVCVCSPRLSSCLVDCSQLTETAHREENDRSIALFNALKLTVEKETQHVKLILDCLANGTTYLQKASKSLLRASREAEQYERRPTSASRLASSRMQRSRSIVWQDEIDPEVKADWQTRHFEQLLRLSTFYVVAHVSVNCQGDDEMISLWMTNLLSVAKYARMPMVQAEARSCSLLVEIDFLSTLMQRGVVLALREVGVGDLRFGEKLASALCEQLRLIDMFIPVATDTHQRNYASSRFFALLDLEVSLQVAQFGRMLSRYFVARLRQAVFDSNFGLAMTLLCRDIPVIRSAVFDAATRLTSLEQLTKLAEEFPKLDSMMKNILETSITRQAKDRVATGFDTLKNDARMKLPMPPTHIQPNDYAYQLKDTFLPGTVALNAFCENEKIGLAMAEVFLRNLQLGWKAALLDSELRVNYGGVTILETDQTFVMHQLCQTLKKFQKEACQLPCLMTMPTCLQIMRDCLDNGGRAVDLTGMRARAKQAEKNKLKTEANNTAGNFNRNPEKDKRDKALLEENQSEIVRIQKLVVTSQPQCCIIS